MKGTLFAYTLLLGVTVWRLFSYCKSDVLNCEIPEVYTSRNNIQEGSIITRLKSGWVEKTQKYLPSPHSELLLGMTIGIDHFYLVPKFKKMLRDTGTIHVVVVSGYNVTLVYSSVIRLLGSPYKARNLMLGIAATLMYAVLSGFEPPVIRAWIMGSIISLGKYYGRKINVFHVLTFTALLIICVKPSYLYSLSFQLSFLATLSLVLFEKIISTHIDKICKKKMVIKEDLSATLAAQVLIWPYLSYKFGQVSIISPVVNALILWTVPLATILGGIFLFISGMPFIAQIVGSIVFMPLDLFVSAIKLFSKVKYSVVNLRFSLPMLLLYYLLSVIMYRKMSKNVH